MKQAHEKQKQLYYQTAQTRTFQVLVQSKLFPHKATREQEGPFRCYGSRVLLPMKSSAALGRMAALQREIQMKRAFTKNRICPVFFRNKKKHLP